MKLLIVDDEELTRAGMIRAIDWDSLHICKVIEADDGVNGLKAAREEKPDIVLSDIRMPRLSGIEMAERIREILPETSIIFMSGYSDRDYLKAAIRLKAIQYVEKPIDPLEVEEAVLAAVKNSEQLKRLRQSAEMSTLAKAAGLALLMTYPPEQRPPISEEELLEANQKLRANMYITSIIVKSNDSLEDKNQALEELHDNFASFLLQLQMQKLHIIKHGQYVVYHVFSPKKPLPKTLIRCGEYLRALYLEQQASFFIAIGQTVQHLKNSYQSYNSAVILLQSSFFHRLGSLILPNPPAAYTPAFVDPAPAFLEALLSKDSARILSMENQILQIFQESQTLLPIQVKDIYYKLFIGILNAYRHFSLDAEQAFGPSGAILDYVQNCHTLEDLHELLVKKTNAFLEALLSYTPEHPTVLKIKEYISRNYCRESLSVKELSDYVHMSSSYLCTFFKAESGLTLNQYITGYRIDKAKQLLADSGYTITDISAKAGYSDGNYFGKLFKKHVGLTPSEYREKILQ